MGDRVPTRDLRELPKAHLHLHFEGAMRPATLEDLARRRGIESPATRGFDSSFAGFVELYAAACDVLQTADDLLRLIDEVLEDAAADGARWIELGFYPPFYRDRVGPGREVLELMLGGLADAGARHGVGAGLMVCAIRTLDPADGLEQAVLAAEFADRGVVAFGLAADEAGNPPEPFAAAFAVAREAGLLSTPHAGELAGPESITGALDALGADRIQHGVRAIEDPALLARLADSEVCLDVCPTSNIALALYPSLAEHPLGQLLDAGARCSVNADDPLIFGPGLLDEYELCRRELGFDDERMAHIARCSIAASGAPEDLKASALAGVDTWLATMTTQGARHGR